MNFYKFETKSSIGVTLINLDTVTDMSPSPNDNECTRLYFVSGGDGYIEVKEKFDNMVGMFGSKETVRRLHE